MDQEQAYMERVDNYFVHLVVAIDECISRYGAVDVPALLVTLADLQAALLMRMGSEKTIRDIHSTIAEYLADVVDNNLRERGDELNAPH